MGAGCSNVEFLEPRIDPTITDSVSLSQCKTVFEAWDVVDVQFALSQFVGYRTSQFNVRWIEMFRALESTAKEKVNRSKRLEQRWWHPCFLGFAVQKLDASNKALDVNEDSDWTEEEEEPYSDDDAATPSRAVERREGSEQRGTGEEEEEEEEGTKEEEEEEGEEEEEEEEEKKKEEEEKQEEKKEEEEEEEEKEGKEEEEEEEEKEEEEEVMPPSASLTPAASARSRGANGILACPWPRNRSIPADSNCELLSPVFFGYNPITELELERQQKVQDKIDEAEDDSDLQERIEKEESEFRLEQQQIAANRLARDQVSTRQRVQRERAKKKREDEMSAARETLPPRELAAFETNWKKVEERIHLQEAQEDARALTKRTKEEETEASKLEQLHLRRERALQMRFELQNSPKGLVLLNQSHREMDVLEKRRARREQIHTDASLVLAETQAIMQGSSQMKQVLALAQKKVDDALVGLEKIDAEIETMKKKILRYENLEQREALYSPLFRSLHRRDTFQINLLEIMSIVTICCGARLEQKQDCAGLLSNDAHFFAVIFSMFDFSRSRFLSKDDLVVLLSGVVHSFERIGEGVEPASMEELEDMASKAFVTLGLPGNRTDILLSQHQFRVWSKKMIAASRSLSVVFNERYMYDTLTEYQKQNMHPLALFARGLVGLDSLKRQLASEQTRFKAALAPQRKQMVHVLAMSIGASDPTKPDYTKFFKHEEETFRAKIRPLNHGCYANLNYVMNQRMLVAVIRIQTNFRGKRGRRMAYLEAQRQAFLKALEVAKTEAKRRLEEEFNLQEHATGMAKMKWDAKVRMRQVKLRASGRVLSREEVVEVMRDEALGGKFADIEKKFMQMARDRGVLNIHEPLVARGAKLTQATSRDEHRSDVHDHRLIALYRGEPLPHLAHRRSSVGGAFPGKPTFAVDPRQPMKQQEPARPVTAGAHVPITPGGRPVTPGAATQRMANELLDAMAQGGAETTRSQLFTPYSAVTSWGGWGAVLTGRSTVRTERSFGGLPPLASPKLLPMGSQRSVLDSGKGVVHNSQRSAAFQAGNVSTRIPMMPSARVGSGRQPQMGAPPALSVVQSARSSDPSIHSTPVRQEELVNMTFAGETPEEFELRMRLSAPVPTLDELRERLYRLSKGFSPLKCNDLLAEFPAKRLLCRFVTQFRDCEQLVQELVDHFELADVFAEECAWGLFNLVATDTEFGVMEQFVRQVMYALDLPIALKTQNRQLEIEEEETSKYDRLCRDRKSKKRRVDPREAAELDREELLNELKRKSDSLSRARLALVSARSALDVAAETLDESQERARVRLRLIDEALDGSRRIASRGGSRPGTGKRPSSGMRRPPSGSPTGRSGEHFSVLAAVDEHGEVDSTAAVGDEDGGVKGGRRGVDGEQSVASLIKLQKPPKPPANDDVVREAGSREGLARGMIRSGLLTAGSDRGGPMAAVKPRSSENINSEVYGRIQRRDRHEWMYRYLSAVGLPESTCEELLTKHLEIQSVLTDFLSTAEACAKVIIEELYLPMEHQTIRPSQILPTDFHKDLMKKNYTVNGIRFTIAVDWNGLYGGSDECASKAAKFQIRGAMHYTQCKLNNVHVPLSCIVDHCGFRLLARAVLPLVQQEEEEEEDSNNPMGLLSLLGVDEDETPAPKDAELGPVLGLTTRTRRASTAMIRSVAITEKRLMVAEPDREGTTMLLGTFDRGETVVVESRQLLQEMKYAAEQLNLAEHGVRGRKDITEKRLFSAADLCGFRGTDGRYYLLGFRRAFPSEDSEACNHLPATPRLISIAWRQLRPEFVASFEHPLSPDAMWLFSDRTCDFNTHSTNVALATTHLIKTVIPNLAIDMVDAVMKHGRKWTALDVMVDCHRIGVPLRHLGLLRRQLWVRLPFGKVHTVFGERAMPTSTDLRSDLWPGDALLLDGVHYTVSDAPEDVARHSDTELILDREMMHDEAMVFECICIGLLKPPDWFVSGASAAPEVKARQQEYLDASAAVREVLLVEMLARTFKSMLRLYYRHALRLSKAPSPLLMLTCSVRFLNLISGCDPCCDEFWREEVIVCFEEKYGLRGLTSYERLNLRESALGILGKIVLRLAELVPLHLTESFKSLFCKQPSGFRVTAADMEVPMPKLTHRLYQLHASIGEVLAVHASLAFASSYPAMVLSDYPIAFWQLNERKSGRTIAVNSGSLGSSVNGRYLGGVELEGIAPVENDDIRRSALFGLEKHSRVDIRKYDERLGPLDPDTPFAVEGWAYPTATGGLRVVAMSGRFQLAATGQDKWSITLVCLDHNTKVAIAGGEVVVGEWQHVVASFDGTMLRLYVNSTIVALCNVQEVGSHQTADDKAAAKKQRHDIRQEARDRLAADKERLTGEAEGYFRSNDGKKYIKAQASKLQEQVELKLRLARKAEEVGLAKGVPSTPGASSSRSKKKKVKKLTKKEAQAQVRAQYIADRHHTATERVQEDTKIRLETLQKREQTERRNLEALAKVTMRIGSAAASKREKSGRQGFIGYLAHVAVYPHALTPSRIVAHYTIGTQDQGESCSRYLNLATDQFWHALCMVPHDGQLLARFAETLCADFVENRNVFSAGPDSFTSRVDAAVDLFFRHSNLKGLTHILRALPESEMVAELAVKCYNCILDRDSSYFDVDAEFLGGLPERFRLYGDGAKQHHLVAAAHMVQKALAYNPMIYMDWPLPVGMETVHEEDLPPPDQAALEWITELETPRLILRFVQCVVERIDLREMDLRCAQQISPTELLCVTDNRRDTVLFNLSGIAAATPSVLRKLCERCPNTHTLILDGCPCVCDESLEIIGANLPRLETISLKECNTISDAGVRSLAEGCLVLSRLYLDNCGLVSDKALDALAVEAEELVEISFRWCSRLTDSGMFAFASRVNAANIISLDLGHCMKISDNGVRSIAERFTKLHSLDLSYCHKVSTSASRVICNSLWYLTKLVLTDLYQIEDISFVFDEEGDGRRMAQETMLTNMKKLYMEDCRTLTNDALNYIFEKATRLDTLHLTNADQITDDGTVLIITDPITREDRGNCLRDINLSFCLSITDVALGNLATRCSELQTVDFTGCCSITDKGLLTLIESCDNIQNLTVSHCRLLTDASTSIAASKLWLEHLNVGYCQRVSSATVDSLARNCPGLRSLDLSWCADVTDTSLQRLAERCTLLRNLTMLCLDYVTDETVAGIRKCCPGIVLKHTRRGRVEEEKSEAVEG